MKRDAIERLLPEVFRRTIRPGSPLAAILDVMEDLHAPDERVLDRIDAILDPVRTDDAFVPYLAGWLDLERLFEDPTDDYSAAPGKRQPVSTGLGRLRELIGSAAWLSQWRGTSQGLRRFLEIATGVRGFEIDERVLDQEKRPIPFHIRVRAPGSVRMHRSLLDRIIQFEKPAYVTYDLDFGS
jgi:phage tail-like protein